MLLFLCRQQGRRSDPPFPGERFSLEDQAPVMLRLQRLVLFWFPRSSRQLSESLLDKLGKMVYSIFELFAKEHFYE